MQAFAPVPSFTDYLLQANDTLVTMIQIETQEALDAVDEIAAIDGVDVLFIGPFDLGAYKPPAKELMKEAHRLASREQHRPPYSGWRHGQGAQRCHRQDPGRR